jgi:Mrp family chromosome partitioning ATPase
MGRIAEALKRAQHERARRTGGANALADAPILVTDACAAAPTETATTSSESAGKRMALAGHDMPQGFVVSAPPITPDMVGPEVLLLHDPGSPIAERYRSVRTRLITGNPAGSARIFAMTSSLPREGKTVTTANMGFSLAELRHLRVAMIDCDFRQQGLSRLLGVEGKPGLAEVIRGERSLADVCIPVVRNNLFFVPTGDPKDDSPSDLLAGTGAAAVFRELTERFHYGLIDTPPTNTVADIGLVAPLCHSIVIVIRMSWTPEHVLRRCVRMLQANHVAIAGSILVGYCEKTMAYTDTHDYYDGHD